MDFIEKCVDFICKIHAQVGDDVTRIVSGDSLARELGYDIGEARSIAEHLEKNGYITWRRTLEVGGISITSDGIVYARNECKEIS